MSSGGQHREAVDVLLAMARRMERHLDDDPGLLPLYGMLLLPAEIAAASDGDASTAESLHDQAEAVARRLGPSYSDRVTTFGMTNVALHRLAALVRLQEGAQAVTFARAIDPSELDRLPRERKAVFWMDLAEAHRQAGDQDQAVRALIRAEVVAPEEVRCRPLARSLIARLLSRPDSPPAADLRQLAQRAGVTA
jgi:hypothetical protein